mmetsp:Transcript_11458/g.28215  ORF Transcript_11458/g.28215 Transcript_11458/m.28215 type:complete len:204 (+) Transcript_11458:429-1040(+)
MLLKPIESSSFAALEIFSNASRRPISSLEFWIFFNPPFSSMAALSFSDFVMACSSVSILFSSGSPTSNLAPFLDLFSFPVPPSALTILRVLFRLFFIQGRVLPPDFFFFPRRPMALRTVSLLSKYPSRVSMSSIGFFLVSSSMLLFGFCRSNFCPPCSSNCWSHGSFSSSPRSTYLPSLLKNPSIRNGSMVTPSSFFTSAFVS